MIVYNKHLADNYNSYHSRSENLDRMQVLKIANYLQLSNQTKVLDAGCGSGRLLHRLENDSILFGVEKSPNMFKVCKEKTSNPTNIINSGYVEFLYDTNLKFDAVYFSYSLHQISESVDEQIKILKDTFVKLGCEKILLITISPSQMNENVLNINSNNLNEFDRKRFITKDDLSKHFQIDLYEEETVYTKKPKTEVIELIQSNYISSIQILTDSEKTELINNIESNYPELISYPDFYTYILISNE